MRFFVLLNIYFLFLPPNDCFMVKSYLKPKSAEIKRILIAQNNKHYETRCPATVHSARNYRNQWKLYEENEVSDEDEDYEDALEDMFEGTWDGWVAANEEEVDLLDYREGAELIEDLELEAMVERWRRVANLDDRPPDEEEEQYTRPSKANDPYLEGMFGSVAIGFEEDIEGQALYNETDGDGYTYYCYSVNVSDEIGALELEKREFQDGTNLQWITVVSSVPVSLQKQIRIGDILLAINSKPVLTKTKEEIAQCLSEAPKPLTLLLKHELYKTLTFREGRLGLILSEGKGILNKLVISDFRDRDKDRIPDHNLAQHVELLRGDSVVAIQGVSVADLSFDQAIAILKKSTRPLDLTVFAKPFRYPLPDAHLKPNLQNPAPIFTDRPFTTGNPRKQEMFGYEPGWRGPDVRPLDLLIENGGSLTAAWYPSLPYNPYTESQKLFVAGGRGKIRPSRWKKVDGSPWKENEDERILDILFKAADLRVPPIPIYFLPTFLIRLEVMANEIRGTVNLETGEIELTFDSVFELVAFDSVRSGKINVICTLSTEATDGGFIKVPDSVGSGIYVPRSEGLRLDYFGRAKLVGRAILEATDDTLTNILVFLPTIGLAEVPVRFFLPDKGGIPLQKEVPVIEYNFNGKDVQDEDSFDRKTKKWWVPEGNSGDLSFKDFQER